MCFTILVLPVLLDEEYWSFQYRVLYNTSNVTLQYWIITHYNIYNTGNISIVNITILVIPVL
jgi:hypothetical protein